MSVQECTLVDVRDPGDHALFIFVTPQTQFTDNDGVSHSSRVRFDYTADALPNTSKVPRSDAAGNSPAQVLYTIRRVLGAGGPGNRTWTNVLLDADTVNLNSLTVLDTVPPVTVSAVTEVDGQAPDAEGHVALNAVIKPASGEVDGQLTKWSDDAGALLGAIAGTDFVDPTDYLIDQANRTLALLAQAAQDAAAGDNRLLGLVGGAAQWTVDTPYPADSLVGYGGLSVFKATPPVGWSDVLENLPPYGRGDGSMFDRLLLLQRRVGFGAAATGGLDYDTITVTTAADYLSTDTPVSGSLRWAIEVQARSAGGGWIIFDKTVFADGLGTTIKLKQHLGIPTSNVTIDGRGASVTVTGGDGSYAEGGQPGRSPGTTAAYGTKQTVTISGAPTGGTFTLSSSGNTTPPLAYNASAGTVQAAIQAFGGAYAAVTVTGTYSIAYLDTPFTANGSGLTGGLAPNVTVSIPTYTGNFDNPHLVNTVPTAPSGDVYACVDAGPALSQSADLNRSPLTSPRWEKVRAWVSGTTYKQATRVTSPADGKSYVLVKPIGGYTQATTGVSGTNVKVSNSASTVDPSTDRHDLDAVGGHWEPIGKTGFCFYIGAMEHEPASFPAKFSFTDPAGCNGLPAQNIIVEKISKVDNWGGESSDTGSSRVAQIQWFAKDVWFDRCLFTNPDKNNDGLFDIRGPATNITRSSCHFKRHHKALLTSGIGTLTAPAVNLVMQANPDLVTTYGSGAAGYALWNDSANLVVKTNKLDSAGHVIDWTTVTFPANGEFEHGQGNPEQYVALSVDHTDPGHDLITLQARPNPKKHLAAANPDGTPTVNSGKKAQLYRIGHFLPGLTDDYPRFTDSFGINWIDLRVTTVDCWLDEMGSRGPDATDEMSIEHVLNCYMSNWGVYQDPLLDASAPLNTVFPCLPSGLTPSNGAEGVVANGARLKIEGSAFEHAAGATGGPAKMITNTNSLGYLVTSDILDIRGDSTTDPDRAGGDFSAISTYSYTARPSSVVKNRVTQSAGPVSLWVYDHDATIIQDATTSTKGAVQLAGDLAGTAASPTVPGKLVKAANLSDLASASTARTNLGLGTIATQAAPAGTVVGTSDTQTLSNKRRTARVLALSAGSATPAINTDSYDVVHITAQSAAITSFTTNLTGTPVDGDMLRISITDDGTARAITWGASFASSGTVTLPTTTVASTRLDVGFFYNSETSKWRCVATA